MAADEDRAAKALTEAAAAPTPEQVRALAERALARVPEDMDPEQIRALAAQAVGQALQVSKLLNRLAALTERERS